MIDKYIYYINIVLDRSSYICTLMDIYYICHIIMLNTTTVSILLGLIVSSLFHLFYSFRLSLQSILFFIFIYFFSFFFFCMIGFDFIGILILLIYVGGLFVIIIFSVFSLKLDKSVKSINTPHVSIIKFIIVFISLFFVLISIFSDYLYLLSDSIMTASWYNINITRHFFYDESTIKYSIQLVPIFKAVSFYMYTFYFIPFIGLLIILLIGVIGIILITTHNHLFNQHFLILDFKYTLVTNRFLLLNLNLSNDTIIFSNLLSSFLSSDITLDLSSMLGFCIIILSSILTFLVLNYTFDIVKFILLTELLCLCLFMFLSLFSFILFDLTGVIFILYILGILAVEMAVGLALYIIGYYNRSTTLVKF